MKRNFIAKRFQSAGTGLTLDTAALAKYKDIVDLSIGDSYLFRGKPTQLVGLSVCAERLSPCRLVD